MKGVSCEMRDSRRNVNERQNTKAGERYEQQRNFAEVSGAQHNFFAAGTARIFVTYEVPTDHQRHKHELGKDWCHFRSVLANSIGNSLSNAACQRPNLVISA